MQTLRPDRPSDLDDEPLPLPRGLTRLVAVCLVLILAANTGCASIRITDPPRTATEQFLLSGAAAKAVGQLTFGPLRGRRVFVDTQYFAASEQQFVLGELRARLLLAGVNLVPIRDDAEVVMEVRSGGVGIDREDFLLGLPALVLSTEEGGLGVPFATPEIALLKNTEQWGIASVAFVAYWRETGDVVASSGPYIGWTTRDDWWFFGMGPNSVGNIPPVAKPDLNRPEPPGQPGEAEPEEDPWPEEADEGAAPPDAEEDPAKTPDEAGGEGPD